MRRLFHDVIVNLLRKFTRLFKKMVGGQQNREWREVPEESNRELWRGYRTLMETVTSY